MGGSILGIFAKGLDAFAQWLRAKQQAKDQADGATAQVAADRKETNDVQAAEIKALVSDSGADTADKLHDGSF